MANATTSDCEKCGSVGTVGLLQRCSECGWDRPTETRATPGPWIATPDCTSEHDEGRFIVISQPGHTQAVIAKLPNYAAEDARLIAAAPDLFAALVALMSYVETQSRARGEATVSERFDPYWDARRAIRLVGGEK